MEIAIIWKFYALFLFVIQTFLSVTKIRSKDSRQCFKRQRRHSTNVFIKWQGLYRKTKKWKVFIAVEKWKRIAARPADQRENISGRIVKFLYIPAFLSYPKIVKESSSGKLRWGRKRKSNIYIFVFIYFCALHSSSDADVRSQFAIALLGMRSGFLRFYYGMIEAHVLKGNKRKRAVVCIQTYTLIHPLR